MKQVILQPITKIEEVLDLLTDPEKYVQYLKDLRDAHTMATDKLADVDTKEKAERMLAEAFEASEFAVKHRSDVLAELARAREAFTAEQDRKRKELYQKLDEYNDREAELSKAEKAHASTVEIFNRTKKTIEDEFDTRQAKMVVDRAALDKKMQEIDEKRAKAEATLKALE